MIPPADTESRWFWLDSGPGAAAWNMAMDHALLEDSPSRGAPILRFYSWTEPAATFGLLQRYADAAGWTMLRPLVRRPTGGGLVPHLDDWTYSIAIPPNYPWYARRAADSYRLLHAWIQSAFAMLGLDTRIAPARQTDAPGQCFVGAEAGDLLWGGRKIAGAAQRRTRQGLLIQGSIQPPPPRLNPIDWQASMRQSGAARERIAWLPFNLPGPLSARIEELIRDRYGRAEYNQQR